MDPNLNLQTVDTQPEVENTLVHDTRLPENNDERIYPDYIEDEWDNISGDIILFV